MYANITFRFRFYSNFHNIIFIYSIYLCHILEIFCTPEFSKNNDCKILLSLQVESILNYGQVQEDQHEQNMSQILTNISDSSTMTSNQTQVVQHSAIGKLVKL